MAEIINKSIVKRLNMRNEILSIERGVIEALGKNAHGRNVLIETKVKVLNFELGRFGKSTKIFYLSELHSPEFNTLDELINHYE